MPFAGEDLDKMMFVTHTLGLSIGFVCRLYFIMPLPLYSEDWISFPL